MLKDYKSLELILVSLARLLIKIYE